MAWVTKSTDEQYTPEPPPREYTKKEKAANWWHYHKMIVAVVAIIIVLIAWIAHDMLSQVDPDLQVAYVGPASMPTDTVEALQEALTPYCTDRNGDGEVIVQVKQFNVSYDSENDNTDPYMQMAGLTQLSAELADGSDLYIYLLADPSGFQEQTMALRYLDGTLPPDGEAGDWQKMVYRWTDCPVLTGLDLGTCSTYVDDAGNELPNQELMTPVYVAFRGNWNEEIPEAYTADEAIWNTLTAGAVSTVAEE